jgi:excinuclease ABC subunit A
MLVDQGNTVIVIEHNLEVIKSVDWIIDLGPEGGEKGGYLVAEGMPSDIVKNKKSLTGKYLKSIL